MPTTSQSAKRIQVIHGRPSIKYKQETIPRTGITGHHGVLNALGRFGSRFRRMRIPTHTRMNANNVPMFVRSTISSMLVNIAQTATAAPVRIVVTWGGRNRGWPYAHERGSKKARASDKKNRC